MNTLYSHQKNIFFIVRVYLDSLLAAQKKGEAQNFDYEGIRFLRIGNTIFPPNEGNLFADPHTLYKDILLTFRMIQETGFEVSGGLLSEIRFASHFFGR